MKSQHTHLNKEKEPSIVQYIKWRIKSNKNFICAVTGPTGSGKSWTTLSMAQQLDEDFNIDRIVFKAKDLMALINSNTLTKGSVIVWDEAGIDLSNRNWQSTMNKVMNYLLQTFRHKNFILFFTVPYSDFVDATTRKLFHAEFTTIGINKRLKTCSIKPKMLQYNASLKKWYAKYLIVRIKDIGASKIKRWRVKKPTEELIKHYESKKQEFTSELNQEIQQTLELDNIGKIKYQHIDLYLCYHMKVKKQKDIAALLGVTSSAISGVMQTMDKRYYNWRNDANMLGDLGNLTKTRKLSPSQLKFLENDNQ